ncbi:MAG: PucR family transcriptional regulator [Actinomycetota bacterium]|nr:helix-turn-helix domain-containing protein [Actinomycetota bacterium]
MPTNAELETAGLATGDGIATARARIASVVEARIEELTDAMLAGYLKEIEAYASLDNPSALAEVRNITRMNVQVILHAVADGAPLDDQALAVLRELGRLRAAQGFPLHALLRAYQIGTRVAWQYIIDALNASNEDSATTTEIVASVSVAILGITAQISGAVTQAFLEAERETAATEERVRRDVFNELLSGPIAGGEPLRERAERIGYRLGSMHAVAVITTSPRGDSSRVSHAAAVIDALRTINAEHTRSIIDARGLVVIALFVVTGPTTEASLVAAIESGLAHAALPGGVDAQGALGRIESGIAGIAVSYRQAMRALDAARAMTSSPRIASFTDLLPALLLMHDTSLSADLYRAMIEPLARNDADQGTQLLATLTALFEERGNLIATAKRLFVHRHTLTARLERIEELTARSLRSRNDVLLLELGLRTRAVLPGGQLGSGREARVPVEAPMDILSSLRPASPDRTSVGRMPEQNVR